MLYNKFINNLRKIWDFKAKRMRVIQTKNNTIRLIFNPKTDGLCLSDFLIVRDGEDNFLGQIIRSEEHTSELQSLA